MTRGQRCRSEHRGRTDKCLRETVNAIKWGKFFWMLQHFTGRNTQIETGGRGLWQCYGMEKVLPWLSCWGLSTVQTVVIHGGRSPCRLLVPPRDDELFPLVCPVLPPDWPLPPVHTGPVSSRWRMNVEVRMIRQRGAGEQMIERKRLVMWKCSQKKENEIGMEEEQKVGLMCYRTDELTGEHWNTRRS